LSLRDGAESIAALRLQLTQYVPVLEAFANSNQGSPIVDVANQKLLSVPDYDTSQVTLGMDGLRQALALVAIGSNSRGLKMLSSFVPVALADAGAASKVIEHIRQVGSLLSAMGAPCIVLADEQSPARERVAGRVPADGSQGLNAEQWRNVAGIVGAAKKVAADFGLDIVFHPHVATFVETPAEVSTFFDATCTSGIGLCLDTGHCYYGGGDPAEEADKYKGILRYLHIKDIDRKVLDECHRRELDFNQAVEEGVFTTIGEGCLDFPAFFARAAANGYHGWCVVEQDIKYGVSPVAPKQSMTASLRYLRTVVGQA